MIAIGCFDIYLYSLSWCYQACFWTGTNPKDSQSKSYRLDTDQTNKSEFKIQKASLVQYAMCARAQQLWEHCFGTLLGNLCTRVFCTMYNTAVALLQQSYRIFVEGFRTSISTRLDNAGGQLSCAAPLQNSHPERSSYSTILFRQYFYKTFQYARGKSSTNLYNTFVAQLLFWRLWINTALLQFFLL